LEGSKEEAWVTQYTKEKYLEKRLAESVGELAVSFLKYIVEGIEMFWLRSLVNLQKEEGLRDSMVSGFLMYNW